MEDRGRVQRGIEGLQRVHTWQLVILFIIAAFIAATFLRLNNIGMVQRREAVLVADSAGNDETVLKRLYDLQHYVTGHMNTNLGKGVYLEKSYNRDVAMWQQGQYGTENPHGNIYKKAQEVCAPKFSSWSQAYIQCTTNELAKYPAASDPSADSSRPRQEAYIHNFATPVWSPDFAGWSVVVTAVILLLIVIRLLAYGILKIILNRQYRRV